MNILDNIAKTSRKLIKQVRGEAFCGGCGGSNVCSCAGSARSNCPCGCLRACPCVKPRYCPFRRCNYCPRNCRMKCMRCLACNAGLARTTGQASAESFTAITNYPKYDQCLDGTAYGQLYNGNIHQRINPGSGQNVVSTLQTCYGNPLASGACGGTKIADDCSCAKKIAADSYMIFSDANKYFVGPIGVAAKKDGKSFYYSPYRGCV